MKYIKKPISLDQQITILKQRGLIFDNEGLATETLKVVSYFRMAQYWKLLEQDKTNHTFRPNSKFSSVLNLYNFDSDLRSLVFKAIQTIEIALRTKMIHHIGMQYGSFWFMEPNLALNSYFFRKNLDYLREEVKRSQEEFIAEHRKKYSDPDMPPVWKTLEVSSLGTLSKLLGNFNDSTVKNDIAKDFDMRKHIFLSSWIESLTVLRNHCAHHSRIWNRRFAVKPLIPRKMAKTWIVNTSVQPDKIYPQLCCIAYWLNNIKKDNTFTSDFKNLLSKYPNVDPAAMGFPRNWKEEPLWK